MDREAAGALPLSGHARATESDAYALVSSAIAPKRRLRAHVESVSPARWAARFAQAYSAGRTRRWIESLRTLAGGSLGRPLPGIGSVA